MGEKYLECHHLMSHFTSSTVNTHTHTQVINSQAKITTQKKKKKNPAPNYGKIFNQYFKENILLLTRNNK